VLSGGRLRPSILSGHEAIGEALLQDLSPAVELCRDASSLFFVGRGPFFPLALEGALKMKEITYIHAEGYAAGEIKHGPFALLSQGTPVVALCPPGESFPAMVSNIREMKARGVPLVVMGDGGSQELQDIADVLVPFRTGILSLQSWPRRSSSSSSRTIPRWRWGGTWTSRGTSRRA